MAEIDMMMPKEQGIKIKQPVEGLLRLRLAMTTPSVTLSAAKGLADSSPLAQNDKGMPRE